MWEPWNTFRENQKPLPIRNPPCRSCARWNPVRRYNSEGAFLGVTLCHYVEMQADFSCWTEGEPHEEEESFQTLVLKTGILRALETLVAPQARAVLIEAMKEAFGTDSNAHVTAQRTKP